MDFIDHRSTANFIFGLSATDEKVRITSDGDVGIGVSNPSTKLEVDGTVTADEVSLSTKAVIGGATPRIELFESDTTDVNTRFRNTGGTLQIQSTDDAGTTSKTRIAIDHATGDISFREDTGSNAKLYWDASAESLGIGTDSPSTELDVAGTVTANSLTVNSGNTNTTSFFQSTDATADIVVADTNTSNVIRTNAGGLFINTGGTASAQGTGATPTAQFATNGDVSLYEDTGTTAKFFWDASAESLGIGTTPTQALDVVGDIQTSGGIYVGGSAAANKLDDYEEGTWTPVIADATSGGNTGTAATLDGAYTKVGRQVTVTFRALDIDTTGMTSSNNLVLRNLPFTSGTGVTGMADGSVRLDLVDLNDSACNVTCSVGSSGSVITFRQTVDNGNDSQIAVSAYNSGTADILGTLTYFTN